MCCFEAGSCGQLYRCVLRINKKQGAWYSKKIMEEGMSNVEYREEMYFAWKIDSHCYRNDKMKFWMRFWQQREELHVRLSRLIVR